MLSRLPSSRKKEMYHVNAYCSHDFTSIWRQHEATTAQIALAWLFRRDNLNVIPKASTPAHVRENHASLNLHLIEQDITMLDHAFPPPTGPRPLEML